MPSEGKEGLDGEELDIKMCCSGRSCAFPNLLSRAGHSVLQLGSGC